MITIQEQDVAVLGICVEQPLLINRVAGVNFHAANSAHEAIDMLRMLDFDFVLVGLDLPDVSTDDFLRFLKTARPQQKWALVGEAITAQQEITARMFGATTFFDTAPTAHDLLDLTAGFRRRASAATIGVRSGRTSDRMSNRDGSLAS